MAIVVQCYHCNAILELDDGFRGGVCRCSQCGSLLQVPKSTSADSRKARPAAPGAAPSQPNKRPGTPLEDPGLSRGPFDPRSPAVRRPDRPVGDPGISSGAFSRTRPIGPPTATAPRQRPEKVTSVPGGFGTTPRARNRRNNVLLYTSIALAICICVALGAVLVKSLAGSLNAPRPISSTNGATVTGGGAKPDVGAGVHYAEPGPVAPPAASSGPSFFGLPLKGKQIVFSIDSASSAQDAFSFVIKGLEQAIGTLGDDQQFKVAFWTGDGLRTVPQDAWATKADAKSVTNALESLGAMGTSDAAASMKASLKLGGDQVIFVTAKYGLTPDLTTTVLLERQPNQRIDAIKLGPRIGSAETDAPDYPLHDLPAKTGGEFLRADIPYLETHLNRK